MSVMHRDRDTGAVTERTCRLPSFNRIVPRHIRPKNTGMARRELSNFWPKGIWPANSPDLSSIENLWSINKLITSMPERTSKCIQLKGGYVTVNLCNQSFRVMPKISGISCNSCDPQSLREIPNIFSCFVK